MVRNNLITISMPKEAERYVKDFLKTLRPLKRSFSSFITEASIEKVNRIQEENGRRT